MPFLSSFPSDAGPPTLFKQYSDIYEPWAHMSQALMNGPSALTQGERELILTYAAALGGCDFVAVAHAEVAYAWGVERGTLDVLMKTPEAAPVSKALKVLLAYVRKLVLTPTNIVPTDVDAVLAAGWDEQALHHAIAITGRAAFMQRLVQGYGFNPLTKEVAAEHAQRRVERGYVNLYNTFRKDKQR